MCPGQRRRSCKAVTQSTRRFVFIVILGCLFFSRDVARSHEFALESVINAFVKVEPRELHLVVRALRGSRPARRGAGGPGPLHLFRPGLLRRPPDLSHDFAECALCDPDQDRPGAEGLSEVRDSIHPTWREESSDGDHQSLGASGAQSRLVPSRGRLCEPRGWPYFEWCRPPPLLAVPGNPLPPSA